MLPSGTARHGPAPLRNRAAEFCEHGELSDADVGRLVRTIRDRVQRALRGPRKVLAAIHDPESIRKVLGALGLSAEVPGFLPARSPPRQRELEFDG